MDKCKKLRDGPEDFYGRRQFDVGLPAAGKTAQRNALHAAFSCRG